MCSSRGAAVASSVRVTTRAQRVQRRWGAAVGHHNRGDHPLTQPVVGKSEHRAVADGRVGAQRGLDGLGQHGQPAGADRVVGAAQHGQHARIIEGAQVVGAEPARFGERVGNDRVAIALGQRRATDRDAAIGQHAQPDAVERDTVVHTASRGLAHPVGADHRDAGGCGGVEDRPGSRSAADQHGIQFGERAPRPPGR